MQKNETLLKLAKNFTFEEWGSKAKVAEHVIYHWLQWEKIVYSIFGCKWCSSFKGMLYATYMWDDGSGHPEPFAKISSKLHSINLETSVWNYLNQTHLPRFPRSSLASIIVQTLHGCGLECYFAHIDQQTSSYHAYQIKQWKRGRTNNKNERSVPRVQISIELHNIQ